MATVQERLQQHTEKLSTLFTAEYLKKYREGFFEPLIGQTVVVRSEKAGVFFGVLFAFNPQDCTQVYLTDSRRIWEWAGANSTTDIAFQGVMKPDGCRITVPLPIHAIMGVVEIMPASEEAIQVINGVPYWNFQK